jgi:hypothetical protein
MAKFADVVGYASSNVETAPGVFEDVIVEKIFYGDVVRNSRSLQVNGERVNFDVSVNNNIRILANETVLPIYAIRYVRWAGKRWIVTSVEVQRPRLILELGGVYNGPTPDDAP